jgi:ribulose-phosphate 3-epimerase
MDFILSASILSADFTSLADQIQQCEKAGVDWIHIDVMDGHFVPNLTMGPFIVEQCRKITHLPLDCHLMIEKPENLVDAFIKAGASSITIHPEGNPNILKTLVYLRSKNIQVGVAINPETDADVLKPLLTYCDLILVMTVHPGYSGQSFMPEMVEKIKKVKKMIDIHDLGTILQVDGGINPITIKSTSEAGANCFVAATAIFHNPVGISNGVNSLRAALN